MSINEAKVRELAARAEDHRLDFKSGLYSSNAELAKDLMAIANLLPPGSTGYLLLGVRQRPDETGEIVGVDLGSDRDSNYQQKIAHKLNRSPRFTFFPLRLQEGEVGVFEITGIGERPYFPIVDEEKLKKFIPQKRLGSSTAHASPDEVKDWVLEDRPTLDPGILLDRIPEPERDKVLIAAEMLDQNFQICGPVTFPSVLLGVNRSGAVAQFRFAERNFDVYLPLAALRVYREGSTWRVDVDGYLRATQNETVWEYQPPGRGRTGIA